MTPTTRITNAVGEFFLLALLVTLPCTTVYIDTVVFGQRISEISTTELTQEALLLLTALTFWRGAWKSTHNRGFLILLAGFFSTAFIRELDALFDIVWHGFWVWLASAIILMTLIAAMRQPWQNTIKAMANFIDTKPYFFIIFGLLILLVFSRTFGCGRILWNQLLGVHAEDFKGAVQEGIELLGYIFIAYGTYIFWRQDFQSPHRG